MWNCKSTLETKLAPRYLLIVELKSQAHLSPGQTHTEIFHHRQNKNMEAEAAFRTGYLGNIPGACGTWRYLSLRGSHSVGPGQKPLGRECWLAGSVQLGWLGTDDQEMKCSCRSECGHW